MGSTVLVDAVMNWQETVILKGKRTYITPFKWI